MCRFACLLWDWVFALELNGCTAIERFDVPDFRLDVWLLFVRLAMGVALL